LRVPEDIALVGIDDVPYLSAIDPFLTVAAQPAYEMGESAAQLLVERLTARQNGKVREVVLARSSLFGDRVGKSCVLYSSVPPTKNISRSSPIHG